MKVRFRKLVENAVIPTKAHSTDAGFDLVATSHEYDGLTGIHSYGTGIAVEIPEGYVGLLFSRSSIYKQGLIQTNSVGVIDSGYRGEVKVKFYHLNALCSREYQVGDRVAQLIILPYPEIEFEETDDLTDSDRGEGGYGSTGR